MIANPVSGGGRFHSSLVEGLDEFLSKQASRFPREGAIAARIPFGLVPAGSGNDFAGAIGLGNNLEHAIETLVRGQRVSISIVKVITSEGSYYSINLADAGIGARAAVAAQTWLKWLYGPLRYNLISWESF